MKYTTIYIVYAVNTTYSSEGQQINELVSIFVLHAMPTQHSISMYNCNFGHVKTLICILGHNTFPLPVTKSELNY